MPLQGICASAQFRGDGRTENHGLSVQGRSGIQASERGGLVGGWTSRQKERATALRSLPSQLRFVLRTADDRFCEFELPYALSREKEARARNLVVRTLVAAAPDARLSA